MDRTWGIIGFGGLVAAAALLIGIIAFNGGDRIGDPGPNTARWLAADGPFISIAGRVPQCNAAHERTPLVYRDSAQATRIWAFERTRRVNECVAEHEDGLRAFAARYQQREG